MARPSRPASRKTSDDPKPEAAETVVEEPKTDEPDESWFEQHRAEVLAKLPPEDQRPKNIYGRLSQILGLIGVIKKRGFNDFHRYPYAKEEDLVEEIRPMLSEYGIWIEQGLAVSEDGGGDGIIPHQRVAQFKQRDNVTVESLTIITKRFRFVWWNPEAKQLQTTEWVLFGGYGDDTGDKGYNKAETSAVKYFLMKTFMVATGNDPEADKAADERAARREAGPVNVQRAQGRPAQPGGRQQQTSSAQTRQIGELLRANGAKTSAESIEVLEAITGDKIPVPAPAEGEDPDLPAALAAYVTSLPGPKAGAVVRQLREMAAAAAGAKPEGEAKPDENGKPAAAGWTEVDDPDPATAKVWSEGASDSSADGSDDATDGTIDNAIA